MPIPILYEELPNLSIVDWCLIATEEVSIGTDVIEIMWTWKNRGRIVCPDRHLLCSY